MIDMFFCQKSSKSSINYLSFFLTNITAFRFDVKQIVIIFFQLIY